MHEPKPIPTDPPGVAVTRRIAALLDQAASAGIGAQRGTGSHTQAMAGAHVLSLCYDVVALLPDRVFPDPQSPTGPGRSVIALVQEAHALSRSLPLEALPPGMASVIAALADTVGEYS